MGIKSVSLLNKQSFKKKEKKRSTLKWTFQRVLITEIIHFEKIYFIKN